MKRIGITTLLTSAMAAAILSAASPALAVSSGDAHIVLQSMASSKNGIDHLEWLDRIRPNAKTPKVDTSVRHSR
jgi:hypothetical protein